jgi:Xaa-Pro aminopeptidase
MKQDLDALMRKHDINYLWISGPAQHNSNMVYFTGDCHVTNADLFYIPGQTPILLHGMMEREEAAKTGYRLISYSNYPNQQFLTLANNDMAEASALRYKQILEDLGITKGRVMLYGVREFGPFFSLITRLQQLLPELAFTGDPLDLIMVEARATKSSEEIERIRQMGIITTSVVQKTRDLLTSHQVVDEKLIKSDGQPLTIGDVKARINLWLAESGVENPEGTIFAIGRDGGIPHSSGTPSDPIKLGEAIVYDIFPCEAGGGYFYDFTRTWCLGYAPDEVLKAYEQVKQVYDTVVSELEVGVNPARYQARTCELYEAMGHETIRQNPKIEQGYIHSLGHGVGLDVHEKPFTGLENDPTNLLRVGSVMTIEPGLYYPEKGFGIRLEDTWYVKPDRTFAKFVDFPMDLVIPMKGG